jgi:hypothetical protein
MNRKKQSRAYIFKQMAEAQKAGPKWKVCPSEGKMVLEYNPIPLDYQENCNPFLPRGGATGYPQLAMSMMGTMQTGNNIISADD